MTAGQLCDNILCMMKLIDRINALDEDCQIRVPCCVTFVVTEDEKDEAEALINNFLENFG